MILDVMLWSMTEIALRLMCHLKDGTDLKVCNNLKAGTMVPTSSLYLHQNWYQTQNCYLYLKAGNHLKVRTYLKGGTNLKLVLI